MIKPLQDYVVLEEIKKESKLIIVDGVDFEPTHRATVIEMGENSKLPIKSGDTVLIKEYGFEKLKLEDKKEILIGKEENIYAIIK
ncbi:co-chaperone GroES family protein [Candidatus Dojkabacteria bacterium]|jgi:co-chaperonin GroES (HSP10)|nr:co-chaperone GroES family protein [Candidatus Dojkabacteria bacterium]